MYNMVGISRAQLAERAQRQGRMKAARAAANYRSKLMVKRWREIRNSKLGKKPLSKIPLLVVRPNRINRSHANRAITIRRVATRIPVRIELLGRSAQIDDHSGIISPRRANAKK